VSQVREVSTSRDVRAVHAHSHASVLPNQQDKNADGDDDKQRQHHAKAGSKPPVAGSGTFLPRLPALFERDVEDGCE
jgi:hypothetical protein